jgi:methylated-DNA-protein-cysteine methyltransferase-like protein
LNFRERVFAIVGAVPTGRVVTYGQVAALAGFPRRARQVGHLLRDCPPDVPWQRVVGAGGRVRLQPGERQWELLRSEGVVTLTSRIDMKRFHWQPGPLAFA